MNLVQLKAFSAVSEDGKKISIQEALRRHTAAVEAINSKVPSAGRQAPERVRGLDVGAQLIVWSEKVTAHAYPNKGKPGVFETTDYKVRLFKRFDKYDPPLKLNPKVGRIEGNTLILYVQVKRWKTDEELRAWEKSCDERKVPADGKERQQKFVYETGGEYHLVGNKSVIIKIKGPPKQTTGGSPITEKMLLLVQGIQAVQDLTRPVNPKTGEHYGPSLEASNVQVCDLDEEIDTLKLIREAALDSALCDLSQANGYGMNVEPARTDQPVPAVEAPPKEVLDEGEQPAEGEAAKSVVVESAAITEWKARLENVPPSERPLATGTFAMDFRLDELGVPSADVFVSNRSFYPTSISCPADKLLILKDGVPSQRTCELIFECQVMEGGDASRELLSQPTKQAYVKFSPRTYKEKDTTAVLLEYGLINLRVWAGLAPELVPKCDFLLEATVNLGETVSQTTNTLLTNPIDPETGRPKTGYDFATVYNIITLIPDLVSGVMRVGLPIDIAAAKVLLKRATGQADLGSKVPQELRADVELCPLNKTADKKVLNLFLYPAPVDSLQSTHQFFLVMAGAAGKWEDMKRRMIKNKEGTIEAWSRLVSGGCRSPQCEKLNCTDKHNINPKSYKDFPKVGDEQHKDPTTYVVFAVSNAAVAEFSRRPPPSEEAIGARLHQLLQEAQKRSGAAADENGHKRQPEEPKQPEAKKQRVVEENPDDVDDIGL